MSDQPQRRFKPPWDIEDNGACFIVPDPKGQALSYVYFSVDTLIGVVLLKTRAFLRDPK